MDTMRAFANGEANRGKESMVFDWHKLVNLIKKHKPKKVIAGLSLDMEWTSGTVYKNGEMIRDSYTYLSSTWATPVAEIDGIEYDCFVMASETEWNEETKWPQSAIDLFNE